VETLKLPNVIVSVQRNNEIRTGKVWMDCSDELSRKINVSMGPPVLN